MAGERITVKDVAGKIDAAEREIGILKAGAKSPAPPFYKNIPIILSMTALLFSFGTTYVSYQRTKQQDIHALRAELRNLLQRLTAIPKDEVEVQQKYSLNPNALTLLSGYMYQETSLLARQAAEIVRRLPLDQVSGVEFMAVGRALLLVDDEAARALLGKAVEVATGLNDEVSAIRNYASLMFKNGKPEEGRVLYKKALELKAKYNNYDPLTHMQTQLAWANAEHTIGERERALEHVKNIDEYVASLPVGPIREIAQTQVNHFTVLIRGPARVVPILPMPTGLDPAPEPREAAP